MIRPGVVRAACAAGVLTVLFLASASCSIGAGAPAHPSPANESPPTLEAVEGAEVTAHLDPGESHVFSLVMAEGTYLEVWVDRPIHEISLALFDPDIDPAEEENEPYVIGEIAPEYPNQMLWEVIRQSGEHHLRVDSARKPVDYTLRVEALHPATARDQSRHDGLVTYTQGLDLRTGQTERALKFFIQAREQFVAGTYERGICATYTQEADIARKSGHPDEAIEEYRRGAEHCRLGGDAPYEVNLWSEIAEILRDRGDWETARDFLDLATQRAKESGDPVAQARAYHNFCAHYRVQGRSDLALDNCLEALEIRDEYGLHDDYVASLVALGRIYSGRGEFDQSLAFYSRALKAFETYPNPALEATVHNNLGVLHLASGEYLEALLAFQHSLEIRQSLESPGNTARVVFNLGTTYSRLGDLEKTRSLYHRALKQMEDAHQVTGAIEVLQGLAWLYREMGDLQTAQAMLDKALERTRGVASDPLLAYALLRTGELQTERGDFEQARETLEESRRLYEAIDYRWQVPVVLRALAAAYAGLERDELAIETLRRAAEMDAEIGKPSGAAESFYRIALLQDQRGDLSAAMEAVRKALSIGDEVRGVAGAEETQALYAATVQPYQELLIDLLMKLHARDPHAGHAAAALREAERRKAQGLREIIAEARLQLDEAVPRNLQDDRERLRSEIEAIERRRRLLDSEGDPAQDELFQIRIDLDTALTGLQKIEHQIRAESPRYAALTSQEPVSVDEIQRSLLDADTALLEYSLGEKRSFLWVVTEDEFLTYELPGRAAIEKNARCVHRLITEYGNPPAPEEIDAEMGGCLGANLDPYRTIPPSAIPIRARGRRRQEIELAFSRTASALAEDVLGGPLRDDVLPPRLALVSDGALEYVPFAALPVPPDRSTPRDTTRQFVDDHEIVRLPSASVLAVQRRQHIGPSTLPPGLIAIVADPVYSADDPRVVVPRTDTPPSVVADDQVRGIPPLPRLDLSADEAEAIASLAPDRKIDVIEGFGATRDSVLSGALEGHRYVHFATHGEIDTQNPKLSSLVLSQVDASGRRVENGNLRLEDIYGLDLADTDMVVLSACETALGREVRGEGLMGLTRGFLYAGAKRVAATLWQVQDRTNADLMEHFYRGLFEENRAPADALRRAQIALRDADDGAYSFPYYWAGFVLQGEWR